LLVERVRDVSL